MKHFLIIFSAMLCYGCAAGATERIEHPIQRMVAISTDGNVSKTFRWPIYIRQTHDHHPWIPKTCDEGLGEIRHLVPAEFWEELGSVVDAMSKSGLTIKNVNSDEEMIAFLQKTEGKIALKFPSQGGFIDELAAYIDRNWVRKGGASGTAFEKDCATRLDSKTNLFWQYFILTASNKPKK